MTRPSTRVVLVAVLLALIGAACAGDTDTADGDEDGVTSTTERSTPLDELDLELTRLALIETPIGLVEHPTDGVLYVVSKVGHIRAIRDGDLDPDPVLDLTGEVATGPEQGLLGLAFSLDGSLMYVDYTDLAGDVHVVEYDFTESVADPSSARELFLIEQVDESHNGGQLAFGPDGMLWIGVGDGGNLPDERAQDLGTLLGKLLRVDPTPSAGAPYTIPPDNPFVGTEGARGEIWAFGLRNPWRFSFDRETDDLWLADVGEMEREEINLARASSTGGENYGWPIREGLSARTGPRPVGAVDPLLDYGRDGRCTVIGGFVYRGSRIPELRGSYLFGDFCDGKVRALRHESGRVTEQADLGLGEVQLLTAFGEDGAGELYALSFSSAVYRIDPVRPPSPTTTDP